jgi:hypothetical protein
MSAAASAGKCDLHTFYFNMQKECGGATSCAAALQDLSIKNLQYEVYVVY